MDTIKVKKTDLLRALLSNRTKHAKNYQEALEGFYRQQIKAFTKAVTAAKKNRPVRFVPLVQPVSQLDNYDQVIAMLKMATETEIVLSHEEFDQYFRDKWSWSRGFATVSNMYLRKKIE